MKIKKLLNLPFNFIAIGLINIALFHYGIYRLFIFLYDSSNNAQNGSFIFAIKVDLILTLFFTLPHSILLVPDYKKKLLSIIPNKLYSTLYSIHACIAIILMDKYWISTGNTLIQWSPTSLSFINILYGFSWIAMFWSMWATGLFRQSGIEEWWLAIRNKPYKRDLKQTGPYQICRQPIYASFLGMIWFSPYITIDRLLLALFWTGYIIWGATQKEKRLGTNRAYKLYAKKIPAFPFIPKKWDHLITKKVLEDI